MLTDALSDEKLAKIFMHYVYRDTGIEAYHHIAARMDEALYTETLHIVSSKLRKIARNHRRLASLKAEECEAVLRAMYPSRGKEFLDYALRFRKYAAVEPGID